MKHAPKNKKRNWLFGRLGLWLLLALTLFMPQNRVWAFSADLVPGVGESVVQSSMFIGENGDQIQYDASGYTVAPNKGTDLYRILEQREIKDIARTDGFRFREGSSTPEPGLEGKYFYESMEDANIGASKIMRPSDRAGAVKVKVTVPNEALKHTIRNVDGVSQVQFIEMDDLSGLPIQEVN